MINVKSLELQLLQSISSRMNNGSVGLIYMDITKMKQLEDTHGRGVCEDILLRVRIALDELSKEHPHLFSQKMLGDDFFLYVALNGKPAQYAHLEQTARYVKERIEERLNAEFSTEPRIEFSVGHALLYDSPERELESVLYSAMKHAIRQARISVESEEQSALAKELHQIVSTKSVSSHYQPIVSLTDGTAFGFEALARGPEHSPLRSPLKLFEVAERENMLYPLDKLTREQAIRGCALLSRHQRVFLNVPAHIFHDPDFTPGQTLKLLKECGLEPHNVVFEITERSSIEDFATVKHVIQHYRNQGYRIAIDDAGAGYSSLQAIAEIQPDYIKIDRSLVQNIHKEKVKEYILETFITFAKRLNIKLVAEGIELKDELTKLMQMGVHYAQGFWLGRPQAQIVEPARQVRETILRFNEKSSSISGMWQIGDIIMPVESFQRNNTIAEAAQFFRECVHEQGAVVTHGDRPVGLLMRENVFRKLSVQYGVSLYGNREVTVIMDEQPLIVEWDTPLETVSMLSTGRDLEKQYDLVIVTRNGALIGAASVRAILESMTNVRMEHARVANPLTGLPGNLQIHRELLKRIMEGKPFSVVYSDLDYFKWFNDRYGFQRGDEMIQYTADVMQQALVACGTPRDFVGHIGGDDFIAITEMDDPEIFCKEIIRRFELGTHAFYENEPSLEFVEDRLGNRVAADGVTISLSLLVVREPSFVNVDDIARASAYCKSKSKALHGSAYVIESVKAGEPTAESGLEGA